MLAVIDSKHNFGGMNKLTTEARVRVISCLVEGNSIRATVRLTGIAKNTVVKLLADVGRACSIYQDRAFRGLILQEASNVMRFGPSLARKRKTQRPRPRRRVGVIAGPGQH